MPSNYTQNYNLNQWEADDQVCRTDFNADNAKIDAAIKAVDQRVDSLSASKADASALSALSQAVAGKGNCQVVYGQYTGNGIDPRTSPVTLTFDKKPLLVLVADTSPMIAVRGAERGVKVDNGTSSVNYLTWTENGVSWTIHSGGAHLNAEGTVYHYVAFLEA